MNKAHQKNFGTPTNSGTKGNVTLRRPPKSHVGKMATLSSPCNEMDDSLFIDSFLSQGEIEEVKKMLDSEGDLFINKSVCTSTQIGKGTRENPILSLSPINITNGNRHSVSDTTSNVKLTNRFETLLGQEEVLNCLNKVGSIYQNIDTYTGGPPDRHNYSSVNRNSGPWDRYRTGAKPLDDTDSRVEREMMQGSGGEAPPVNDAGSPSGVTSAVDTTGRALGGLDNGEEGTSRGPRNGSETDLQGTGHEVEGTEGLDYRETKGPSAAYEVNPLFLQIKGKELGANGNDTGDEGDEGEMEEAGSKEGSEKGDNTPYGRALDAREVVNKLDLVSALLNKMDVKSDNLAITVKELQVSLEYSQSEIDKLKGENTKLKQKLTDLETEERRVTYHQKRIEEKIDRVDTAGKKKNLILEGIPEIERGERRRD